MAPAPAPPVPMPDPNANRSSSDATRRRVLAVVGILSIAVVGTVLAVTQPWNRRPPPVHAEVLGARLELASGEVMMSVGENGKPTPVQSNTPLPLGAKLETKAGARALVRLGSGARVFLSDNTSVVVSDHVELSAGRIWLESPAPEPGQEVVSHRLGEHEVALSDGGASLRVDGNKASVYVAEGLALVNTKGGRADVEAGEEAVMVGSAAPAVSPVKFWVDWTGGMGDRDLAGATSSGSGALYAVDRSAAPGSPAMPLSIQRQVVHVAVEKEVAETRVDQTFFNPSNRDVEGWYWFTVPNDAQLIGFALETDGVLVEGEIVERQQAARTYEAAVRRARDPALLEWVDARTVRARIYPVPGAGTRRVVIRYQQLLHEEQGKLRYTYPLTGPGGREAASIEEFGLEVELRNGMERAYNVASTSDARVEQDGRKVSVRRSGFQPRADFQLELDRLESAPKRAPLRVNFVDPGGDAARYVMLRWLPDLDFDSGPAPAGEVVVVVDTSAFGDAAEQQAKIAVVEAFLRSLSEGDRFALVAADLGAKVVYPAEGLSPANPDAIGEALEALAKRGTGGATDLGAIFEASLERVHGLEQPAIVYVGDGIATSGERSGEGLSERLRRSLTGSHARLFTVGVGTEIDEPLLTTLAREGGGDFLRVEDPAHAVMRALQLSGRLKTPTVTDLRIELGDGLDDVFVSHAGKLSRGEELTMLARTHHDLPPEVKIKGTLRGEPFERSYPVSIEHDVVDEIVPRLWAVTYVERLLSDTRGLTAVRGKVLSLGLEYGLMTPFTSFLALESEAAYAQMGVERRTRRFPGPRLTADAAWGRLGETERAHDGTILGMMLAAATAPMGCAMEEPGSAKEAEARNASDASRDAKMAPSSAAGEREESAAYRQEAKPTDEFDDATRANAPAAPPSVTEEEADPGYYKDAPVAEPQAGGSADGAGRHRGEEGRMGSAAPKSVSKSTGSTAAGTDGLFALDNDKNEFAGGIGINGALSGDYDLEKSSGGVGVGGGGRGLGTSGAERLALGGATPVQIARYQRSRVAQVSPVQPLSPLPCSDAASRSLTLRRALWERRLAVEPSMAGKLGVYEASVAACEVPHWRDQRVFLQLLQVAVASEGDVEMLLAHFTPQPEARNWLARALLRRLVQPSLLGAVESSMFGANVRWYLVAYEVSLETDPDLRLQIIEAALARSVGDPEGELLMLRELDRQGKLDDALARARRLRDRGLLTTALVQELGDLLAARGREDDAKRTFSEIIEFDPSSAASRQLLGDIFLRHGWYEDAYRQYEELVNMAPEAAGFSIRLARAALGAGRSDEALRILRKVAAGEGRPGADDPRRWARLTSAVTLAFLLEEADPEVPRSELLRELGRLQLFEKGTTWKLLVWRDLDASLTVSEMISEEGSKPPQGPPFSELVDASSVGLIAGELAPGRAGGEAPKLEVRNTGTALARDVEYQLITLSVGESETTVQIERGTLLAPKPEYKKKNPTDAAAEGAGSTDGAPVQPTP